MTHPQPAARNGHDAPHTAPDHVAALQAELASLTSTRPEDWYLVRKARHGMHAMLSAVARHRGQGPDASVLTQAFTCLTALTPVLGAGLRPVYGDIDPGSLALSAASAQEATERAMSAGRTPAVVVLQHTFGILDETGSRELASWARERGALLLEDSAHAVARMARAEDGAPLADVSIHSFGVQKILPTHMGGAVWVSPDLVKRDRVLDALVRGALTALPGPTPAQELRSRTYRPVTRVLAHLPGALAGRLRSAGERSGLYEPPVARTESDGEADLRPARIGRWEASRALAALDGLEMRWKALSDVVAREREALETSLRADYLAVPEAARAGQAQPLLRLPLLVGPEFPASPDAVVAALRGVGVYAEPWGRPLLYPGVSDAARFGLDPGTLANLDVTRRVSEQIVALPTELGDTQIEALVATLTERS